VKRFTNILKHSTIEFITLKQAFSVKENKFNTQQCSIVSKLTQLSAYKGVI